MAVFQELIKNFDSIRNYMRDFYIYGFKVRNDYKYKSSRTYDNERRRIESWIGDYITWEQNNRGKSIAICIDSKKVFSNPLYAIWKSKSFTDNDITLHFLLLDILQQYTCSADEITEKLCKDYHIIFDVQTVRHKLKEYESYGIFFSKKEGKKLLYGFKKQELLQLPCFSNILESIKYYQETMPFGFIGNTILDEIQIKNTIFHFKHYFMVHTLEDNILLQILHCIKEKRAISFENFSRKSNRTMHLYGIPMKIQVSTQTGRRYVTLYNPKKRRFNNARLDYIQSIKPGDNIPYYDELIEKYETAIKKCWGVSFYSRPEWLFVKLSIQEGTENYIIDRIKREGRHGELLHIGKNTYLYSIESYDANEIMSFIKTFTGRILSVECTNQEVTDKFYNDMNCLYKMYCKNS